MLACDQQSAPEADGARAVVVSIEGSCRPAQHGSEITFSYRIERQGPAPISRVRLFVNGGLTEETLRVTERVFARTATIAVPDRTTHRIEVVAEAGGARSQASATVACVAPTPGMQF